jgi:hypothetical protein
MVSTGIGKQIQRAEAPVLYKMGNYKLNNNDTIAVAA